MATNIMLWISGFFVGMATFVLIFTPSESIDEEDRDGNSKNIRNSKHMG